MYVEALLFRFDILKEFFGLWYGTALDTLPRYGQVRQ